LRKDFAQLTSRRLAVFVGSVFAAESAFFAVVPPLVPQLVRDAHLTTTEVGIMVAAYPAGVLLAAIPSMALVDRRGVRMATVVGIGAPQPADQQGDPQGSSRDRYRVKP